MRYLFVVIIVLIASPAAAQDFATRAHEINWHIKNAKQDRIWTSDCGQYTLDAQLVGRTSDSVLLKKGFNDVIKVKRSRLSKDDKSFVRAHRDTFKDAKEYFRHNRISVDEAIALHTTKGVVVSDKTPIPKSHYDKVNERQVELRANRPIRMAARVTRRAYQAQEMAAVAASRSWNWPHVRPLYPNRPLYVYSRPSCQTLVPVRIYNYSHGYGQSYRPIVSR